MANVLIDVSGYAQSWVKDALAELSQCKNVKFLYTDHPLYSSEISKVVNLSRFLQLMRQLDRVIMVNRDQCDLRILEITAVPEFAENNACDDPHLFAIAYIKPWPYLLTSDLRISKCKNCVKGKVNESYRRFKSVTTHKTYQKSRNRIMKA